VLGVFPDGINEPRSVAFVPGDRPYFYTDGITEAENSNGDEFGDDRLIAAVRSCAPASTAAAIVDTVTAEVALWTGGAVQDDATLIAVAR
jgi:sigma-B regulation protein RsbU (phosphoserine phosphatase)